MTTLRSATRPAPPPAAGTGLLRALALAAVCLGFAVLAAATFVLSYPAIRDYARQAGVQDRYAHVYPVVLDATLVVALAAVLALRGAGWPSRVLAWLTLLVALVAAAGADTLHAAGRQLRYGGAQVTAAVLPWALLLVAFVLLMALLRHARRRHPAAAGGQPPDSPGPDVLAPPPAPVTAPLPAGQSMPGPRQAGPQPGGPAQSAAPPLPVRTPQPWTSASVVPGPRPRPRPRAADGADGKKLAGPAAADSAVAVAAAGPDGAPGAGSTEQAATEPAGPDPAVAGTAGDHQDTEETTDAPFLHRMRSTPTPPD